MSVYKGIMQGLNEALEFEKGNISAKTETITTSPEHPDILHLDISSKTSVKKEFDFFKAYFSKPKKYSELGFRLPRLVLLNGKSETGKLMLIKSFANENNIPFIPIHASAPDYEMRKFLAEAHRKAPSIVFIDGQRELSGKYIDTLISEMKDFSPDPERPVLIFSGINCDIDEANNSPASK